MRRQKIIFVSHCILNTAAKVQRNIPVEETQEEQVRREFLRQALQEGIQLIQLPCPEFTLYGASRWGHTREQFDNPFFRDHCRHVLQPILQQLCAYLQPELRERFEVIGIVGIEGSPSCGVSKTCWGPWGGEFSGRQDLHKTLSEVSCRAGMGIMMEELSRMLEEQAISVPLIGLDGREPSKLYALLGADGEEHGA